MPVLNKIPHKKAKLPENLRPDEKVFLIPNTMEVFRDYRTFFDRCMLYNTAAWGCSVSGKNGFTFKEAMDCENQAKQGVESFQQSLKIPVLYLITLIKRRNCSDLVDELVAFMKDRFFVNEDLIYTADNGEKSSVVVSSAHCEQEKVPLPKVKAITEANGDNDDDDDDDECLATIAAQNKNPPPSAYKYDITLANGDVVEAVSGSQLSRKKNALSKDKLKLFVKGQCRAGSDGYWKVRSHLMALGLEDADAITSFFTLPVPKFRPPVDSHRRRSKTSSPDGKQKKQKGKKKLTKKEEKAAKRKEKKVVAKKVKTPEPPKPIEVKPLTKEEMAAQRRFELEQKKLLKLEEHQRQIEERRLERERQKETKTQERQRQLEERKRQMEYLREYNKPRDDMQCDDLRPLPRATAIHLQHVDTKLFPELVYVIEFCHIFREFLDLDFTHLNVKGMQTAIRPCTANQPLDGAFYELVTSLLHTIYEMRKAENEDVEKEDEEPDATAIDTSSDLIDEDTTLSISNLLKISKICSHQSDSRYGVEMDALPMSTTTISEILRLHIWSSAALRPLCGPDEPAIDFCRHEKAIVRQLGKVPVFDLDPASKLKIIRLLMDQLLVFTDFREFIEESLEKIKETKIRLSEVHMEYAKWIKARDFSAVKEKAKIKPIDVKADGKPDENNEGSNETEEEKKQKKELKKRAQHLQKCIAAFQQQEVEPFVEQTRRSSRRGAAVSSGGGGKSAAELLLEDPQSETLIAECNSQMLAHITEEECVTFDRWRAQAVSKRISAVEKEIQEYAKLLMFHQRVYNLRPLGQDRAYRRYWMFSTVPGLFVEDGAHEIPNELLVPTLQMNKLEEGSGPLVPESLPSGWGFYANQTDIEKLCEALNPRGFRELSLKESLNRQRGCLLAELDQCPIDVLVAPPKDSDCEMVVDDDDSEKFTVNSSMDLQLRDQLLELEDKLFLGSLGSLQIPDRMVWREALMQGSFTACVKEIKYGVSLSETIPENQPSETGTGAETGADAEKPPQLSSVHSLAIALLQIEQGIDRKFVKPPLWPNVNEQVKGGKSSKAKKAAAEEANEDEASRSSDATPPKPTIAIWEESLMRCSNFSQIFLHLSTLDSSVLWSRSILKAHCRICRRRADPASMLLCDGCNLGYHSYCLRPPLKKIPEGDWFCKDCKPQNFEPSRAATRRRGRQKKVSYRESQSEEEEQEEQEEVQQETKQQHGKSQGRKGRVVVEVEEDEPETETVQGSDEASREENGGRHSTSSTQSEDGSNASDDDGDDDDDDSNDNDSDDDGESQSGSDDESAQSGTRSGSSVANGNSSDEGEGDGSDSDNEDGGSGSEKAGSSDEEDQSGSGSDQEDGGSNMEDEDGSDGSDEKRAKAAVVSKKRTSRGCDDGYGADSNASTGSLTPVCAICSANAADEMAYVRCDTCATVFHLDCVIPAALPRKPRGGWNCHTCTSKPKKRTAVASSHQEQPQQRQAPKRDAFEYASSSSSSNSMSGWPSSRTDLSMKRVEQLVGELIKHEDAWPFMKPVNKKQVPDYFEVIKKPMDLGTLKVKMNEVAYKDTTSLLDDVQLIFDNCIAYNRPGEVVYDTGLELCKFFHRRIREMQLEGAWASFKNVSAKIAKLGGSSDGKRASNNNNNNGNDSVPAKQSRRG